VEFGMSRESSTESFPDDLECQAPLLDATGAPSESYSNVRDCEYKKIFGFFSVKSQIYGWIRIICDALGLLVFTASIVHRKPEYLAFILQYIFWSYFMAPLWQNFKVFDVATGEDLSDANGCILGYLLVGIYGLLVGTLDICPRESSDPRYVPLSIYNEIFMITHPGKELNPYFPKNMKRFGVAKIFLLIYSASSRASYNLIVFYNAVHVYSNDHDFLTTSIAFIALVIALTDLRIYLLTSLFGALFNPYMILLTLSLFLPMCPFLLNPSQENPIYVILEFYWRLIVQCS
jgi:hypothetical protein